MKGTSHFKLYRDTREDSGRLWHITQIPASDGLVVCREARLHKDGTFTLGHTAIWDRRELTEERLPAPK